MDRLAKGRNALEMEIVFPDKIIFAYDSLSGLKEDEHEKAYSDALCSVLKYLKQFITDNAKVLIPDITSERESDHIRPNQSIYIIDLISLCNQLALFLYYSDGFEINLSIIEENAQYSLMCVADPVYFSITKIS